MKEYKTVTGDNMKVEFYQNTKDEKICKYATSLALFNNLDDTGNSVNTNDSLLAPTMNEIPAPVSPCVVSTPNQASSSLIGTPSSKRKRKEARGDYVCKKCFIKHGSATDDTFNSLWVECEQRRCEYAVHLFCLGIVVPENDEQSFTEMFKFYCPAHNPKKIPRSSSSCPRK